MEFTNNIEQGTGRVNCVGFFNNGGNPFFTMEGINAKLSEISEYLGKYPENEDILLHREAALSIRTKLRELENEKHKQIIAQVDNLFKLLRESNSDGLSFFEKKQIIEAVITTQPERVQWELTQKFHRKFNIL